MSQNTTALKILKMAQLVAMVQLVSLSAQAAGTCLSNKMDIREDMQKIAQKLAVKYGKSPTEGFEKVAFVKGNVDEIYDEQELKVDRSQPFLNQVNAVGVITDAPIGKNTEYATTVLISPCHVLTNAHAITKDDAQKGKAPVYVSLGQNTCESKNEFAHQDMPGKVIAIGNFKVSKDETEVAEDYAIVRIKNISDIKPVVVATDYISRAEALMIVGFPHRSTYTQKTGLRYPTANFLRMKEVGTDGTFETTNTLSRRGGSGSGLFVLGADEQGKAKVFLAGIHDSEGGRGIQSAEIVKRLTAKNPKALDEIINAIDKGTCN